jgi:hypothetical protein
MSTFNTPPQTVDRVDRTGSPSMPSRRRQDPLLQELWDIKALLNAEANYSLSNIFERARLSARQHSSPNKSA